MELPSWVFCTVWVALLATLVFLSSSMEKKAAMRGSHREPLSPIYDKGLRLFFLTLLMWPLIAVIGFPITAVLYVLYLPFYLDGSEKRGRPSEWLKGNRIFKWLINYFSVSYESEDGYLLDKNKSYVIGLAPHGILPVGTVLNVLSDLTEMRKNFIGEVKLRALAASFCFFVPGYRDLLVGGGVIDAARYNARAALDEGYSITLVPGGASEALLAEPGRHAVLIRKRRGFIKLAIETGAALVACYSFGEVELYGQLRTKFPVLEKVQRKFQAIFGISLPLLSQILPTKAKITTVCAKPIEVTKNEKPTDAEIDAVMEQYIESLQRVFYKFAPKYAAPGAKLEIH